LAIARQPGNLVVADNNSDVLRQLAIEDLCHQLRIVGTGPERLELEPAEDAIRDLKIATLPLFCDRRPARFPAELFDRPFRSNSVTSSLAASICPSPLPSPSSLASLHAQPVVIGGHQ
jgi:hypothetical protein